MKRISHDHLCTLLVLIFPTILHSTGLCVPVRSAVRYAMINEGSKVSLIGLKDGKCKSECKPSWFKDGVLLSMNDTTKYMLQSNANELVIENFQKEDAGFYYFAYTYNKTKHQIAFRIEISPPAEVEWYSKNSRTVGTIIGMVFLVLMIVVLVYYCCSKDSDAGLRSVRERQLMYNKQAARNTKNYNYSGVKFTTQVTVANKYKSKKNSREVRRDSLSTLNALSRHNLTRPYKKSRRKQGSVALFLNPPSPSLL